MQTFYGTKKCQLESTLCKVIKDVFLSLESILQLTAYQL